MLQTHGFSAYFGISEIIVDGEVEAALLIRPSRPERGALRNVINAGRGAVDADVLLDGQRLKRTAKTCGPDIAVLVSSLRKATFADDGGKRAVRRGEHEISRKPLRGECRVIPV